MQVSPVNVLWPGERFPASAQTLPHPGRGQHRPGCPKVKSASWRGVLQPPLVSAGTRPLPPVSPLSWLVPRRGSIRPPQASWSLAHPHWQCVDWQLGTEPTELEFPDGVGSRHPGALWLAAHPPLCTHSLWPLTLLPALPSLFLPFLPPQGLLLQLQPWKQWLQRWN